MYKIALVPSLDRTESVFTSSDLAVLSKTGQLTVNEERKNPDADRIKLLAKDADIVITSWGCPRLTCDILDAAPNLKFVMHAAGSIKGIVSPELWQRGIRVSSSAEPLGKGVAETTLGLTITALKQVWWLNENVRNGEWGKGVEKVRELYNITIGIIGASRVGRHYIRLLHNFDVRILVYDPVLTDEQAEALGVTKVELEDLLKNSDVVSVHAPEIPATYRMLDRERLALLKEDAVLINTARGSIIDEGALVEELRKRRIYACIDVTDPEPPAVDHPLRTLPNVIITPHIAGLAGNGLKRIGRYAAEELVRFINGEKLDGEIKENMLSVIG